MAGVAEPSTSASDPETTVRTSVVVAVTVEHAYRAFTEEMSAWWPSDHHIGRTNMVAIVLVPRIGGRWYELGDDGSDCDWGIVLGWDPPRHVALSWHLDGDFRFDPSAQRSSRVDVWFRAQPDGGTLVELEHSGLDRHGPTWRRLRDSISGGWPRVLRPYVERLGEQSQRATLR
jgi:uncharacterized protein YndB with AHSA1/START domain